MKKTYKDAHFLMSLAAVSMLSACEMYAPSTLNDTRIQVAEDAVSEKFSEAELTDSVVAGLARDYVRKGITELSIVVAYDPRSSKNTAMHAGDIASRLAGRFRDEGAGQVKASILPVVDAGAEAVITLSYTATEAYAPDGCGAMPGMYGNILEPDPAYRLGCGVDTMIAKQVAHPSDLLGRGSSDGTTDGRSASNIIEVYRSGAKNAKLDGENASEKK